jgi:hypothetical protein
MFDASGWDTDRAKNLPVQVFMIEGGMWSGVHITVHGKIDEQKRVFVDTGPAEQNLAACIMKTHNIGIAMIPSVDVPTGEAQVQISDRPKAP